MVLDALVLCDAKLLGIAGILLVCKVKKSIFSPVSKMLGSTIRREREKRAKEWQKEIQGDQNKSETGFIKIKSSWREKKKEPKIKIKINAKEVESQPTINIIHTYGKTFLDIA